MTLVMETNDPIKPESNVPLAADSASSAPVPSAIFSSSSLDIGKIWTEGERSGAVAITPANTAGLIIEQIEFIEPDSSDKGFEFGMCRENLPEQLIYGEIFEIRIRHKGEVQEETRTTLLVRTNDRLQPERQVVVTVMPPLAEIRPRSLDFGDTSLGSSNRRTVAIRPCNRSGLLLEALSLGGTNVNNFTILAPSRSRSYPIRLEEGEELTVDIAFNPDEKGEAIGTLRIETNDPHHKAATITLYGVGQPSPSDVEKKKDEEMAHIGICPNPLNKEGVVVLELESGEDVRIDLYDIGGQQVEKLFCGHLDPGEHRIAIDGRQLSPGIYFCIVEIDGQYYHHVVTREA